MTTAEMERRLVVALRSADSVPVDVATARDRWMRGETDRHQAARAASWRLSRPPWSSPG